MFQTYVFLLFLFLSPSQTRSSESHYNSGAFCSAGQQHTPYKSFPLSPPALDLVPWVWDAVYNGKYVELTTVPFSACMFNRSAWQYVVKTWPELASQLAYGDEREILVPPLSIVTATPTSSSSSNFFGARFICVYFSAADSSETETRLLSEVILGSRRWSPISTFQIRCPVPTPTTTTTNTTNTTSDDANAFFNKSTYNESTYNKSHQSRSGSGMMMTGMRMRIESIDGKAVSEKFSICIDTDLVSNSGSRERGRKRGRERGRERGIQQATHLPTHLPRMGLKHEKEKEKTMTMTKEKEQEKEKEKEKTDQARHLFKLSVCTATSRTDREHIVEWIGMV